MLQDFSNNKKIDKYNLMRSVAKTLHTSYWIVKQDIAIHMVSPKKCIYWPEINNNWKLN